MMLKNSGEVGKHVKSQKIGKNWVFGGKRTKIMTEITGKKVDLELSLHELKSRHEDNKV